MGFAVLNTILYLILTGAAAAEISFRPFAPVVARYSAKAEVVATSAYLMSIRTGLAGDEAIGRRGTLFLK